MSRDYKVLKSSEFILNQYKLIPIRNEDQHAIRKWRNEQIDILRQKEELTEEKQAWYFKNVVDSLFDQDKPDQILFSFLENEQLIGYGGLVHIDWESKNAEISFLSLTERNEDKKIFETDFTNYLKIVFEIGFTNLSFVKLHTTFYDIEQRVVYKDVLTKTGFVQEAKLERHLMINQRLVNVYIYSKYNNK